METSHPGSHDSKPRYPVFPSTLIHEIRNKFRWPTNGRPLPGMAMAEQAFSGDLPLPAWFGSIAKRGKEMMPHHLLFDALPEGARILDRLNPFGPLNRGVGGETSLPQPQNTEQRNRQLREARKVYQWRYDYEALPGVPMANGVPVDELPPLEWIAPVATRGEQLITNNLLYNLTSEGRGILGGLTTLGRHPFRILQLLKVRGLVKDLKSLKKFDLDDLVNAFANLATEISIPKEAVRPKNLEDYREIYKTIKPPKIEGQFQDDEMFALMRVAGQNPVVIQGIETLDDQFPVTDELFQQVDGFQQDSLQQAGAEGRLFIADYGLLTILENDDSGNGQKYGCAPKALFAVPTLVPADPMASLVPVAIQTSQTPSSTNLFTPADGEAWEIAKTAVQTADFNHHELATHLTQTHLQLERFCVATHRQLAENHPLSRLLLPHFQGTLFINFGAELALVNDGGPFSESFYGTMASNRKLVAQVLDWRFNDEIFPRKLKSRKVEKIPYYPYRDDGLRIWNAMSRWVSDYLAIYYGEDPAGRDNAVRADTELAAWATELQSDNGGRLKGFGETDGKIETFAYLVEAVTAVLFTASAQHAAVNFSQSRFAGYPPAMSAALYQPVPEDRSKTSSWLSYLPPMNMAELQVLLTHILTATIYGELGRYDRNAFPDPRVKPVLKAYRAALDEVSGEIRKRIRQDRKRGARLDYDFLVTENIPQSINI